MDFKIKFAFAAFFIIIIQSIIKLIGVILTGSLTFLSESVDTLTDILFAFITIYSIYLSLKPPDYEHMYGHAKIDSVGAMIQGILLVNLYFFLIFRAIQVIIEGSYHISNPDVGFELLLISFSINLFFSRFLIWQAKKRNSLSLRIQGLNLFQDSLRAIIVLINFILALFFNISYLDPYFSIVLSIWIIFSAIKLSIKGIKDLIDVNPISPFILEEIRQSIFQLDHVNAVEDLKVRASGNQLFSEVQLSVENHISIVHANEITKSINALYKKFIPHYNIETVIEMNPLGGEKSVGEKIINAIHSLKSDYQKIVSFKDVNVFRVENQTFLSITIIVDDRLSLEEAHELSNKFENELKEEVPLISKIITHIETGTIMTLTTPELICASIDDAKMKEIQKDIEKILRSEPTVKGYHGLECWTALNFCVLELHIFFDGSLNISLVHEIITKLEQKVRDSLTIDNLQDIIFHSEPIEGRKSGIMF
jgi:cation diffusion facilitator family transporter